MGNVVLPILAEILAVGIDYRSRVVVDAGNFLFVDRHDDNHAMRLGHFLHQAHSWTIRNSFDGFIPTRLLLRTEVRSSKHLLHAKYLHALLGGLLDKAQMLFDVESLDVVDGQVSWRGIRSTESVRI